MNGSTRAERRKGGRAEGTALSLLLLLSAIAPVSLSAQGVLDQFSYDSLRLSGVQLDLGPLGASRLRGTIVGGLRLDCGALAPHVRALVGLSYFKGEFDRGALDDLARKLRSVVSDPDSNFTIDLGRITWSDLTGDVDVQYVIPQGRGVATYLGLGMSVHVRNGSGRAINGTFVEDALDGISAGLNATVATEIAMSPRVRFTMEGRGVISSDLSTVSLRTGVMYRFRANR